MRRTATALDLAAAQEALEVGRVLAGYLLGAYEPETTHDRDAMAGYEAAALRALAARYDGHPLACQVNAKLDAAAALAVMA